MSEINDAGVPEAKGEGPVLSRRGFVAAGACSAVVAVLGGAVALTDPAEAAFVRPPGYVSAAQMQAKCIRCQLCVQACPYSIVQPLSLGQGGLAVGEPAVFFKNGYCDFCMDCVKVCPTGALREGSPTDECIGVAKVVKDSCVAWNWSGCTKCADACPVEGALVLDELGQPVVDESLCNGCGLCENVCPAASLRAYDPSKLERGIYVVAPGSAAAKKPGPLTTAEYKALCMEREVK